MGLLEGRGSGHYVGMKTASLGRKLGDWLGIVPEDEAPWSTAPSVFDIDAIPRDAIRRDAIPRDASVAVVPEIVSARSVARVPPPAPVPEPAREPVRQGSPVPEPADGVLTFREVVNKRRAEGRRRAGHPQAPTRW